MYNVYQSMKTVPLATLALIAVNIAVYQSGVDVQAHGLSPSKFAHTGSLEPIFTSMFLHANLAHLWGNMVCLLVFGTVVEHDLGSLRFTALYFAAGIAGALTHMAIEPSSAAPLVGASGAIFGLLPLGGARKPGLLVFAAILFGSNLWDMFTGGNTGVSAAAHIGGFVAGVATVGINRRSAGKNVVLRRV